jgi:hypothetical protein
MNRRRWIALVVGLGVVSAIEVYVWMETTETEESPPIEFNPLEYFPHLEPGDVVSAFDAEKPDGGIENIEYSDNRKTLLFVLSSTCGTCRKNLPYWNRILGEIQGDVRVFGFIVGGGSSYQKEQALLDSGEIRFPVFRFRDEETRARYKATKVPQTILIGRAGKVEMCLMGLLSDEQVDELLGRLRSSGEEAL